MKVLIVEDETDLFLLLSRFLLKHDFQIVGFHKNGFTQSLGEARAVLENNEIDIAILDIDLQNGNGILLADQLAEKDIPFIFLSAHIDDCNIWAISKTKYANCLIKAKPIDYNQLLIMLRLALQRKKDTAREEARVKLARHHQKSSIREGIMLEMNYENQGLKAERRNRYLIRFEDIYYISTDVCRENYLCFYVKNKDNQETVYLKRSSMKALEKQLPDYFIRIQQSYIVNVNFVSSYHYGAEIKIGKQSFDIGIKYKKTVKEKIENWFGN